MKYVIAAGALFLCSGLVQIAIADPSETRETVIAVHDVFVPENVDRTTDVRIVLSGMFPNSCYQWSKGDVRTIKQMYHEIRAKALVTVNTTCLMVLVPFSKEVNLGKLTPGEHTLRFVGGDDTYFERTLMVN